MGADSTGLPGQCKLIRFDRSLQLVYNRALACPRKDMLRLWLFPMLQPWFVDEWEPVDGEGGNLRLRVV